jgi:predicted TIM-barrel fold metal-dependent hydrolase
VDRAVLVCAQIDHNPANNDYVAECAARYPDRLIQFADVDCSWSPTYHTPGAANRLREAADRYSLKGFTHYLRNDHEWFDSPEGLAFFAVAEERGLIASLALSPAWHPALRRLASRFPAVFFLCHHLAGCRAADEAGIQEVLLSADVPNIYVKLSGFNYAAAVSWDYPYADTGPLVRRLYRAFGAGRLCWGSDYPVCLFNLTYRQALEAFRTHCPFVPETDQALILGGTLERLLNEAG